MTAKFGALLGLGILALAGCARSRLGPHGPARVLVLKVDPAPPVHLMGGTLVQVSARPRPWAAMAWVSGTVKIFGAPVAAFKPTRDGAWVFRTMVPPLFTVPAGVYRVQAWGRTRGGESVRGELKYEVE